MSESHNAEIHGLRGVAASMIFVLHLSQAGDHLGLTLPFTFRPLS